MRKYIRPLRLMAVFLALAIVLGSISAAAFEGADEAEDTVSGENYAVAADTGNETAESGTFSIINYTSYGSAVEGAVFTLKGTCDAGTYYEERAVTGSDGEAVFEVSQAGTYTLQQTDTSSCGIEIEEDGIIRAVRVDEEGSVTLDGEAAVNGSFIIISAAPSSGTVSVLKKWITADSNDLYAQDGTPLLPAVYLSQENPDTEITLTIHLDYYVSFSFKYNGKNYSSSSTIEVTVPSGTTFNEVTGGESPSGSSYIFAGWYSDPECTIEYDTDAQMKKDTDVYADGAVVGSWYYSYYRSDLSSCYAWPMAAMRGDYSEYNLGTYDSYSEAYEAVDEVMESAAARGENVYCLAAYYGGGSYSCMKYTYAAIYYEGEYWSDTKGVHIVPEENLTGLDYSDWLCYYADGGYYIVSGEVYVYCDVCGERVYSSDNAQYSVTRPLGPSFSFTSFGSDGVYEYTDIIQSYGMEETTMGYGNGVPDCSFCEIAYYVYGTDGQSEADSFDVDLIFY